MLSIFTLLALNPANTFSFKMQVSSGFYELGFYFWEDLYGVMEILWNQKDLALNLSVSLGYFGPIT